MKRVVIGFLFLVTLLLAGGVGCGRATPTPTLTPAATPTAPTAAASGEQLYQAHCASCHGANGAGGMTLGQATSADLRQSNMEPMYHNDVELIRRAILDGKDEDNETLDPAMPRWRGELSKEQTDAIIAYLQTLR